MLVAKTCCFLPDDYVNKYDAKGLEAQLAKILRTTTSRDLFVVREQDRTIVTEI